MSVNLLRETDIKIKFTLFVLLLGLFGNSYCQTIYKPLLCKGDIPDEFTQAYVNPSSSQSSDFETMSKLDVHQLLKSGLVLFGDTMSNYVKAIGANILDANDINENVHFYVLRSPLQNAFTSDQGYIFITEGAIAQSNNKDQLAYIVCHELAHYLLKHNYQAFEKRKKIDKKDKKGQVTTSYIEKLKDYYKYSRDHEFEADSLGLEIYLKSGYKAEDALKSLKNLAPEATWFEDFTWDYSYLEDETFQFPAIYKSVDELRTSTYQYLFDEDESYEDEDSDVDTNNFSTHPDWKDRVKKVSDFLKVDANQFDKESNNLEAVDASYAGIKKLAYMESLFHLTSNASYVQAHYLSLELEKRYGKSEELTYFKIITLNGIYYKHFHGEDKVTYPTKLFYLENDSSWNISHMFLFFNALSDKEWLVLLSRINMQQYKQDKTNRTIELYTTKSLSYMKEAISWSLKKYISSEPQVEVDLSYSSKSKRIRKNDIETIREEYLKSAFNFIQGKDSLKYVRIFDDVVDIQKTNSKIHSRSLDPSYVGFGNSGKHLSKEFDTIMVAKPHVLSYINKKGSYVSTQWLNDNYENQFFDWREDAAKKNRLYLVSNYSDDVKKSPCDRWNEDYIMESWFQEKFLANSFDIIPISRDLMPDFSEAGKKNLYLYSSVVVYGNRSKTPKYSAWLRPVLVPYYSVNHLIKGSPKTLWVNILADMETNNIVHIQIESYTHNLTPGYGRAQVYEQMFQTKRAIENAKVK